MIRRVLIVTMLFVAGIGPALADPFEWIYGLTNEQATKKLEEQGFTYVKQEGNNYWWHRKKFCVRFRSVDGIVADATEVKPSECKLQDDGDEYY